MLKIDRAQKLSYTRNLRGKAFKGDIRTGDILCTLIFQQSSMISIPRHVGGHTLALQHGCQTSFCLHLVKLLIVMLRCAANVTPSFFQHLP